MMSGGTAQSNAALERVARVGGKEGLRTRVNERGSGKKGRGHRGRGEKKRGKAKYKSLIFCVFKTS